MPLSTVRSARGDIVNFELLAIKEQLAAVPVPKKVDERRLAIEEREGVKTTQPAAVNELLALAQQTVQTAAKAAPKRK